MIHERDRRTDGQTPHDDIGHVFASHRGAKKPVIQLRLRKGKKNHVFVFISYALCAVIMAYSYV